MAELSAIAFARKLVKTVSSSDIVETLNVDIFEDTVVKVRVFLKDASFIEVYYNQENGKTSFSWIKEEKRVFGADNLDFWHIHPFQNPSGHKKSTRITFEEFLRKVEAYYTQ
ncbi:MAG: hypothetical protein GWO20_17115 [Candidatus Korarchaeota archaeon]|nr:hypothetical protein [Candidatus Korarchaeota archaeon]NIU85579.1 hypothetical protein [Candidatus Thorarchaeota archaeon]NIW15123.1 hypothetical protein [Candidatus Thorarchaeota archaeon]NIW53128.1 hypothetical protein [Candidatus Korarchaeota archaeon]